MIESSGVVVSLKFGYGNSELWHDAVAILLAHIASFAFSWINEHSGIPLFARQAQSKCKRSGLEAANPVRFRVRGASLMRGVSS